MKDLIRLFIVALMLLLAPPQFLYPIQNNSSTSQTFESEEKYSEHFSLSISIRHYLWPKKIIIKKVKLSHSSSLASLIGT